MCSQSTKNNLATVVPTRYSPLNPLPRPLLALLQICGTQKNEYMHPTKNSVTGGDRMIRITSDRQTNSVNPIKINQSISSRREERGSRMNAQSRACGSERRCCINALKNVGFCGSGVAVACVGGWRVPPAASVLSACGGVGGAG
jgi:hypothetical protein